MSTDNSQRADSNDVPQGDLAQSDMTNGAHHKAIGCAVTNDCPEELSCHHHLAPQCHRRRRMTMVTQIQTHVRLQLSAVSPGHIYVASRITGDATSAYPAFVSTLCLAISTLGSGYPDKVQRTSLPLVLKMNRIFAGPGTQRQINNTTTIEAFNAPTWAVKLRVGLSPREFDLVRPGRCMGLPRNQLKSII